MGPEVTIPSDFPGALHAVSLPVCTHPCFHQERVWLLLSPLPYQCLLAIRAFDDGHPHRWEAAIVVPLACVSLLTGGAVSILPGLLAIHLSLDPGVVAHACHIPGGGPRKGQFLQ